MTSPKRKSYTRAKDKKETRKRGATVTTKQPGDCVGSFSVQSVVYHATKYTEKSNTITNHGLRHNYLSLELASYKKGCGPLPQWNK